MYLPSLCLSIMIITAHSGDKILHSNNNMADAIPANHAISRREVKNSGNATDKLHNPSGEAKGSEQPSGKPGVLNGNQIPISEKNANKMFKDSSEQSITYNCPSHCACDVLTSRLSKQKMFTVDCTGIELTKLPVDLPEGTEILRLSQNRVNPQSLGHLYQLHKLSQLHLEANHIYSILNWALTSQTLRYLVLDSNQLDYLPNSSLINTPNLQYYSCSHNQIETLHQSAFMGLTKLEVLIFTANRISEIDRLWFKGLESLKQLVLARNNLHSLYDGKFQFVSALETLDISDNHIHVVYDKAFEGLVNLKTLHLQGNNIPVVPTKALQSFKLAYLIDLSRNHFTVIGSYHVSNINVTVLKMNSMKSLRMIDANSFANLSHLKHLELTQNVNLLYIDRSSFRNVPQLQTLLLYNNGLSVVEKQLTLSIPVLREVDLHSNPLYCDCAVTWLLNKSDLSRNNISVLNRNKTKCKTPNDVTGVDINDVRLKSIPKQCPPRIIPLFEAQYNLSLGDTMQIHCKATGVPVPSAHWDLPANAHTKRKMQKSAASTQEASVRHAELFRSDIVLIDFAEKQDNGKYSCVSKNDIGQTVAVSNIHVEMTGAYVIVSRVTSTTVMVTWANTHHSHDYQLVYHGLQENSTYQSVKIQPYMREYTMSELQPSTAYLVCITVHHAGRHIPVNCSRVETRDVNFEQSLIHSSKNIVLTSSIVCLVAIVFFVCLLGHCSRRYNKKKERENKLYTDSFSHLYPGSLDSISDTTPITYENRIAEMFDIEERESLTEGQITTTSLTTTPVS